MNPKFIVIGMVFPGVGLILTQVTRHGDRLPEWVGLTNIVLLAAWVVCIGLSFIVKESR